MHTGKSVIWLSAFIVLLLINVAVVVAGSMSSGGADESPSQDSPLLTASDEVELDWWTSNTPPGEGPPALKASLVSQRPTGRVVSFEGDGRGMEDYPKLMDVYIKDLKQYLNEYFHITAYRMEEPEG